MVYPSSSSSSQQSLQSSSIRILIVDDQKLVRAKLADILNHQPNCDLVAVVNDGDEAVAAMEIHRPDVVLMDIEMPKMNGIKLMGIITQRFPETKILVLSTHQKPEYIRKIINAGADGYILKHAPDSDLIAALNLVNQGYSLFGSKILQDARLVVGESQATPQKIELQKQFPPRQLNPEDACRLIKPESSSSEKNPQTKSPALPSDNAEVASNLSPVNVSPVNIEEFLPSIEKWLTWGGLSIVTALALAIPATSILKYKTTVKARATVRPAGELRLVQSTTEGEIKEILVEEGQKVNRGDVIATIDSSRLQTRTKQLTKAIAQQKLQFLQLASQIKVLETQIVAERESNSSEILAAKAELDGNRRSYSDRDVEASSQVKQAKAQLATAKATFEAAQYKATRYRYVASQGALSQEQLAEAELEVQQQQQQIAAAEAELQSALAALNPSTAEIEMAQQRIQQIEKSGQANIARLHQEKKALMRQRIEINQQLEQDLEELRQTEIDLQRTNLTATAFGTIAVLNLRNPGQAIQPGQEIARIIPHNAPLELKASVLPQDIAKLETNQPVQMRVSACPYPDYGTLNGVVSKVAQDISQPQAGGNNSPGNQQAPDFFEVTITPQDSSFGRGSHVCHLQLGMEGSTDIVTREESVLNFILRKARLISNV
ncbi:MAG: response regulator [Cyanobacteria bacterium P01_C01_bin.72]